MTDFLEQSWYFLDESCDCDLMDESNDWVDETDDWVDKSCDSLEESWFFKESAK